MLIIRLKKHLFPLSLIGIVLLIVIRNYTWGTWLTGWDNLHSEFNLWMNIQRSIFSVWEEYQGTGLVAGMGHASDLPRQLLLVIPSLLLPTSFIRYFYHFLMIFAGTLGAFYVLRDYILGHYKRGLAEKGAWLGALFYLLNLGTIQYFYTPFEPYSTFWGMFPWELYTLLRYIQTPNRKNLLFLALVNLLATPQGYVQTVFLVYVLCLGIFSVAYLWQNRTRYALKIIAIALSVVFAVNAFWVLPNLYFVVHDVSVTQNSIHNKLDTDKFFQMNRLRGTITDFVLLKEFAYDTLDTSRTTGQTTYMLSAWRNHVDNILIAAIGYLAFILVLIGLFHKNRYQTFLLGVFGLITIAFLSDTILISSVNDLLRSAPLVNQIFRNPFSKFIVPAIFVFSAGFSLGISYCFSLLLEKRPHLNIKTAFLMLGLFLIIYGWPAFQGQFIAPSVRVVIPKEYFDLFSYFKTQDQNARIMDLPQGSFWGWGSYDWGSTGSGFLWYGIQQPIMDRAFDVWSKQLEGYYWELWYALKKQDVTAFNNVLEKYQIQYIIYDSHYTPSDSNPFAVLFSQQDDFLKTNPKLTLSKRFGSITVYKTHLNTKLTNNVVIKPSLPNVSHPEPFSSIDTSFQKLGFYASTVNKQTDSIMPFGSLFTNRFENEHAFTTTDKPDSVAFSTKIPAGDYLLSLPATPKSGSLVPVKIEARRQNAALYLRFTPDTPVVSLDGVPISSSSASQELGLQVTAAQLNNPLILSVNDQDFFTVHDLTTDYTPLGETFMVSENGANTVNIYSASTVQTTELPMSGFSTAQPCSTVGGNVQATSTVNTNSLTLQAKNIAVCALAKEPLSPAVSHSLIGVSFNYTSASDEFPKYCFSDGASGYACLNDKQTFTHKLGFSNTPASVSEFFEVSNLTSDNFFEYILDATNVEDQDKTKQITYSPVELSVYPLVASLNSYLAVIPQDTNPVIQSIHAAKEATLTVSVNKANNSFAFPHLETLDMYKKQVTTATNLPISGEYHLQEFSDPQKTLRIYAQNTYAQFWFKLPNIPSDVGYYLEMKTKNVAGYPLVINAFTPAEGNKYLYTILDKNKDFKQNNFIIPPLYPYDRGMQILFMGSSFNRWPSVNDITDVSLYPIPYDYITAISLTNIHARATTNGFEEPKQVTKNNLTSYSVTVGPQQQGTLVLSQAYHDGWVAFSGFKPLPHILVNNWENGWIVPPSEKQTTIWVIFWPQYLEYVGFTLLVGTIGLVSISKLFRTALSKWQ